VPFGSKIEESQGQQEAVAGIRGGQSVGALDQRKRLVPVDPARYEGHPGQLRVQTAQETEGASFVVTGLERDRDSRVPIQPVRHSLSHRLQQSDISAPRSPVDGRPEVQPGHIARRDVSGFDPTPDRLGLLLLESNPGADPVREQVQPLVGDFPGPIEDRAPLLRFLRGEVSREVEGAKQLPAHFQAPGARRESALIEADRLDDGSGLRAPLPFTLRAARPCRITAGEVIRIGTQ
jgi:hypothetical protein